MSAPVTEHVLESASARVSLLDLGCITRDLHLSGRWDDLHVVLGYADPQAYRGVGNFSGAIVGRVANRIGGAAFTLDGRRHEITANEGPNVLHGGPEGLSAQTWAVERDGGRRLRFAHRSPEGAMGFPGAVDFTVTVTLEETDAAVRLIYEMEGLPDRPTPVNLAQHNYWTLSGGRAPVTDHVLTVPADRYTETDAALIPTGATPSVAGTRNDFRAGRRIAEADPERAGHDLNLCLTGREIAVDGPAARLRIETDQPGLQVYTGSKIAPGPRPLPGQVHAPFHGLALEPQGWPDAVNHDHFPSVIHAPESPYRQRLVATLLPPERDSA